MKKSLILLVMLLAAWCVGQPTAPPPAVAGFYQNVGGFCDMGANVAATVLVPYFEVDSSEMNGLDTLVGLINYGNRPTVAHVVVWNVDSYAVLDFNIYLTEYDVVTFSMRQILIYGNLPNNGCATSSSSIVDGWIDCNRDGRYFAEVGTQNDGLFSSGGYSMDIACYPTIDPITLAGWQCKLSTGSLTGWNANYVGYVTIDNTITCNGGMPNSSPLYFITDYLDTDDNGVGDHGILEMANVFMADYFFYDNANSQSDGYPGVMIEAFGESNTLAGHAWGMQPADFVALDLNTFWWKWQDWLGFVSPQDAREALPVMWGFRYIGNAAFDGGTSVDVWRSHSWLWNVYLWIADPGAGCDWGFPGYPNLYTALYNVATGEWGLTPPTIIAYDEEENTLAGGDGGPSPPPPGGGFTGLILEAQRSEVSLSNEWPLVEESGWIALNFIIDPDYTAGNNIVDQSWLNVRYSALDKYTVGLSGIAYVNNSSSDWNGAGAFVPDSNIRP